MSSGWNKNIKSRPRFLKRRHGQVQLTTQFPRSRPDTVRPACSFTSLHCHRLTVSAIWDRMRSPGLTASTTPAKPGGRLCRCGPTVMATRRISVFHLSSATGC